MSGELAGWDVEELLDVEHGPRVGDAFSAGELVDVVSGPADMVADLLERSLAAVDGSGEGLTEGGELGSGWSALAHGAHCATGIGALSTSADEP